MSATTVTHYAPAGSVQRYSFQERVMHWVTALAYMYCLATGFAFYTPYLFWLAVVLGGGPTSRFWHPILGVAFLVTSVWMHSMWHREMEMTKADEEWLGHMKEYAENHD